MLCWKPWRRRRRVLGLSTGGDGEMKLWMSSRCPPGSRGVESMSLRAGPAPGPGGLLPLQLFNSSGVLPAQGGVGQTKCFGRFGSTLQRAHMAWMRGKTSSQLNATTKDARATTRREGGRVENELAIECDNERREGYYTTRGRIYKSVIIHVSCSSLYPTVADCSPL